MYKVMCAILVRTHTTFICNLNDAKIVKKNCLHLVRVTVKHKLECLSCVVSFSNSRTSPTQPVAGM